MTILFLLCGRPLTRQNRLGLVEEAFVEQPRLLLGGHLDVARRQQEDLLGDPLHAAVQRVGQAGAEVDHPLGELVIGRLQVEDDRDLSLELVGDLLGVVEVARDDQVDLDVGVAVADRAQRARARGRDRLVVGEDVVDLVAARAAGARQATYRSPTRDGPRRPLRSSFRARSLLRIRDRSRGPRQDRSRPALDARYRVGPWLVACFGLGRPTPLRNYDHAARRFTHRGRCRAGRSSPPPRPRPANPERFPSRGGSSRAPRRARRGGRSGGASPPGPD